MKKFIQIILTFILTVTIGSEYNQSIRADILDRSAYLSNTNNKPIILDLDMTGDIDDVCAFRVATELDDENVIDIKLVALSVNGDDNIIRAVDGMLTHDKIDNVIIGKCNHKHREESNYWDTMSMYYSGNYKVLDSVKAYRKVLAESDEKVDIITTGYTFNIEGLINSEPDEYSDLNGVELILDKVGQLWITGGSYPDGYDNNFIFGEYAAKSANFVNSNWPLPIIYFINNQVNMIRCGATLEQVDTDAQDIVTKALKAWGTDCGSVAWDPYAVWCSANGLSEVCQSNIQRAYTRINEDTGYNVFTLDKNGNNYIVFRNPYIENSYYVEKLDNILLRKYYKLYGNT